MEKEEKIIELIGVEKIFDGEQAVENMNLMFGLDETTGLKLKPSAF